ncbi:MAG: anti-repressor SinI family protein [Bacillus sp. (in: Bacteria)]|nr:anti-repressor SinI family protein [Bacillus sp. (in: firmicutes)]
MEKVVNIIKNQLDEEWVQLLEEARQLGITPEEIRLFLEKENTHSKVQ